MNQTPNPRRSGPPHNPGLRELIASKRQHSSPPDSEEAKKGFRGWNERGYLPHRDESGLTQFVTFRLVDSFPESMRSEWEHLWEIEDNRKRRAELESYLDKSRGVCHLRRPEIAKIVEGAIRFFHGARYELHAWVVMPNHAHVLFKVGETSMSEVLESWKKYTAMKANRFLKKKGAFWQADYWDTYMRDAEQERKTVCYIENNPVKAKLMLDPKQCPWSSARFRDEFGKLCL